MLNTFQNVTTQHRRSHKRSVVAILLAIIAIAPFAPFSRAQTKSPPKPRPSDEKIGDKLIRKAIGKSDEDLMAEIMRLMGESARRLDVEFDPGDETQAVQRKIMDQLDRAIKEAAMNTQRRKSSKNRPMGDRRHQPSRPQQTTAQKQGKAPAGDQAADSDAGTPDGAASSSTADGGALQESRRSWGNLPRRKRDEVIQGSSETYLKRYRTWIERYYRALQEAER